MKSMYVLSCLLAVAAVSGYDTAHDDFDYNEFVKNPYLLREYNHCFIEVGPCDQIAAFFQPFIQDAVLTACAKCTQAQKRLAHKFLESLEHYLPEEYELFKKKFDPYELFFEAYRAACAQY
ncbi:unnamed protein product [Arctia plantaginis]|uniref:Chemosensory protein n=1 Tax=Arctia plantaginis TaxID=874455 RepID=A0A8S0ZEE9_ARCPL|nr:unnamed protein product [Arctia plantaginis]